MDATSIILPPGTPFVLPLERAAEMVSLSISTVQKLVRQGDFPKPRLLSDNRVGYLAIEVAAWALQRPTANLLPPPNTGAPKPKRQAAGQ
jgi:prophage regulatory protein